MSEGLDFLHGTRRYLSILRRYAAFLGYSLLGRGDEFIRSDPENQRPFEYFCLSGLVLVSIYFAYWPFDPLGYVYMPRSLRASLHLLELVALGAPGGVVFLFLVFTLPLIPLVWIFGRAPTIRKLFGTLSYIFSSAVFYVLFVFLMIFLYIYILKIQSFDDIPDFVMVIFVLVLIHGLVISGTYIRQSFEFSSSVAFIIVILYGVTIGLSNRYFLKKIVSQQSIVGSGMSPSMRPGEYYFVSRWNYGRPIAPQRGEVITYVKSGLYPGATMTDPSGRTLLIKRVIGVPGDIVQVAQGRVTLNGIAVSYYDADAEADRLPDGARVYVESLEGTGSHSVILPRIDASANTSPTRFKRLGACEYLVLGDNRPQALDSRDPKHGLVHCDEIDGVAVAPLFPLFVQWSGGHP